MVVDVGGVVAEVVDIGVIVGIVVMSNYGSIDAVTQLNFSFLDTPLI